MKLKLKIRNIISMTVLQIQILHLSEYFLINNPNLKKSGCLFYKIPKKSNKNVCFGNFFFHWLEIEKKEKFSIEISKFELSIGKK